MSSNRSNRNEQAQKHQKTQLPSPFEPMQTIDHDPEVSDPIDNIQKAVSFIGCYFTLTYVANSCWDIASFFTTILFNTNMNSFCIENDNLCKVFIILIFLLTIIIVIGGLSSSTLIIARKPFNIAAIILAIHCTILTIVIVPRENLVHVIAYFIVALLIAWGIKRDHPSTTLFSTIPGIIAYAILGAILFKNSVCSTLYNTIAGLFFPQPLPLPIQGSYLVLTLSYLSMFFVSIDRAPTDPNIRIRTLNTPECKKWKYQIGKYGPANGIYGIPGLALLLTSAIITFMKYPPHPPGV